MTLALSKQPRDIPIQESQFRGSRLRDSQFRAPQFTDGLKKQRTAEARHLAHDVRNWLTVLQVYCDLLRTSGAVAGDGRKWIEELSSAVERGQGLVVSLLDSVSFLNSSLLDSGQASGQILEQASKQVSEQLRRKRIAAAVPLKPLDLADAIERRLQLLLEMAGSAIQVEVETVDCAGTTALREPEFERILLNLVRNAIDAMPHGGRLKIALEHGDSSQRSSLVLRVSDTGSGIAAEFLPHIFDSGFSTKLTPAGPGMEGEMERGFGLAIVRELTLGAGGSVRVRSRVGRGTSFAVELPLLSDSLPSDADTGVPASPKRKLAVISEMPKPKRGRRAPRNNAPHNSGANRKGTRVPC